MSRDVRGRLDEHWLDLDYASPTHVLGGVQWDWLAGARFASLYSDFHVRDQFPLVVAPTGDPLGPVASAPFTVRQSASNHSYGAGGHLGLEGTYLLGDTDLALFGRVDGGALAAGNRQTFAVDAQAAVPGAATAPHGATGTATGPGVIPTLTATVCVQFNVANRPPTPITLTPGCAAGVGVTSKMSSDPSRRMKELMDQSEDLRQLEEEWKRFWMVDQPSHLTPERVYGGSR